MGRSRVRATTPVPRRRRDGKAAAEESGSESETEGDASTASTATRTTTTTTTSSVAASGGPAGDPDSDDGSTKTTTTTTTTRTSRGGRGREFGDQMALEGETSHISTIILIMYGAIAGYSVLVGYLTGAVWWSQLAFYFAGMLAFYAWHWMAHTRLFTTMYRIHMQHHLKRFPPSNFYGKPGTVKREYGFDTPTLWQLIDPRASTYFTLAHEGPLYFFMGIILVFARVVLASSWYDLGAALVLYMVMGLVGSALHASFHVRNFELEQYTWYMELRALHYVHHLGNMKHNFAVLNLGLDGLFSSLALVDPVKSSKHKAGRAHVADSVADADLPHGLQRRHLRLVRASSGLSSYLLGLDHAHLDHSEAAHSSSALRRGYPTVLLRLVLVVAGTWLWFTTQDALAPRGVYNLSGSVVRIADPGMRWLEPVQQFLNDNRGLRTLLCQASAVISELSVFAIIAVSVAGRTFRPFLALAAALITRLLVTMLGAIRSPAGPMWDVRAVQDMPHFFVMPETAGRFLCPRMVVATVVAGELIQYYFARGGRCGPAARYLALAGAIALPAFQAGLSVALRTHWSFDVALAYILARGTTAFAGLAAPLVDAFLP